MNLNIDLGLLRRFNLNHFVSFLGVADARSFRGAAERLNLSQSALSIQILQFEQALGVRVFHRTSRVVTLTTEGERLLPVARHLMHEISVMVRVLHDEAALQRGIVNLATVPSITASLLPAIVEGFASICPGIEINLVVRDTSRAAAQAVQDGEADVGLLYFMSRFSRLDFVSLFLDPFVAVVPSGERRLAGLRGISLGRLAEFPFLLQPRGTFVRDVLDGHFAKHRTELHIRQELLYPEGLVALVSAGLGVAVIPQRALAILDLTGCRLLSLNDVPPQPVGMVTSTDRSRSPGVIAFHQFVADAPLEVPNLTFGTRPKKPGRSVNDSTETKPQRCKLP